jgi:hypothetical protein
MSHDKIKELGTATALQSCYYGMHNQALTNQLSCMNIIITNHRSLCQNNCYICITGQPDSGLGHHVTRCTNTQKLSAKSQCLIANCCLVTDTINATTEGNAGITQEMDVDTEAPEITESGSLPPFGYSHLFCIVTTLVTSVLFG